MSKTAPRYVPDLNPVAGGPQAGPGVGDGLVMLTVDATLQAAVYSAALERDVIDLGTESDLAAQLVGDRFGVAVIDASCVTTPIAQLTQRLKAQFPDLVLIVAGDSEDQHELTGQITSGSVYRFLRQPVSDQRVKLFVEAAFRRRNEEHSGATGTRAALSYSPEPATALPLSLLLMGGIGGLVLIGIAAYFLLSSKDVESIPAATSAAAERVVVPASPNLQREREIERLLTSAEDALLDGRLGDAARLTDEARALDPDHVRVMFLTTQIGKERERAARTQARVAEANNVRDREAAPATAPASVTPSRTAKPAPPDDPGARERRRVRANRIVQDTRSAIDAGDLGLAEALIQAAEDAGVERGDIIALTRRAEQLRITQDAQAMAQLSQLFNQRLAQGRLVEVSDSAKYYLAQLAKADPKHPSTSQARMNLTAQLLKQARDSSARRDFINARRWLSEAAQAGADNAAVAAIEAQINTAQNTPIAPLPAAVPAPTASPSNTRPGVVMATTLERIQYASPEYPRAAREASLTGWVELQYMVRADGSVSDVRVIESEPNRVFDLAAIQAVRKWRYKPVIIDGQAVDQPARIRVRFAFE